MHVHRIHPAKVILLITLVFLSLTVTSAAHSVTIDWAWILDPGNKPDDTGFGKVDEGYRIGKVEVSNEQYGEFLNAVGRSDPNGLYNTSMGTSSQGGITRSGGAGSYQYDIRTGMARKPVNFVSYYDSLRFVNWLDNGQPIGTQSSLTTEDGAYTFLTGVSSSERNEDASLFLPSEDEWYKAAYYDAVREAYWEYPTARDIAPFCVDPPGDSNAANCRFALKELTDVGAYVNSPSAYGTSDQGGNVFEWNEAMIGDHRGLRGGSWIDPADTHYLAASYRSAGGNPDNGTISVGFRVAAVIPEPTTGLLVSLGLIGLSLRPPRSR
jgi:sulfatase modifying factor 1